MLWCKTIPYARNLTPIILHNLNHLLHCRLRVVVFLRRNPQFTASATRHVLRGRLISEVPHSSSVHIRLPAMHLEIPSDTDGCNATCRVLFGAAAITCLDHVTVSACMRDGFRRDKHFWVSFFVDFLPDACQICEVFEVFQAYLGGFTMESFEHVLPSMKLAIPSAVMVCFQSGAFEILVLLAGLMPDSELSTSLIAIGANTEAISYMITYGFSAAVSTRVSNEIGAGNIEQARNVVSVTLKLLVLLATTFILLLAFCHNQWVNLFSNNQDITTVFAYMTSFLAGSILFDSAQGVLSGVARGCGWQHLAAWTNLVAFYLIVMPLALLFAFKLEFYA